jgi:hypothetical protein
MEDTDDAIKAKDLFPVPTEKDRLLLRILMLERENAALREQLFGYTYRDDMNGGFRP